MNTIIIIEFILISFFYIYNIHSILRFISGKQNYSPIKKCSLAIFLAVSYLLIKSMLYLSTALSALFTALYITAFTVCIVLSNNDIAKKISIYTAFFYIAVELTLQSAFYLCFEFLLKNYNQQCTMLSISLFINTIIFVITKTKSFNNKVYIIDLNVISPSVYLLILAALFLSGLLLENQLMIVSSADIELKNQVTKFLSAISIPILILILICLMFNGITKNHYKSLSKLLEKQINKQLKYYEALDKKNDEIKKFRHDFKNHMICLQSLINGNDISSAADYIKELTQRDYINPSNIFTGNKIADAILVEKTELAEQFNIQIEFQGEISDIIPPADICIILSNALDNAIEECQKNDIVNSIIDVRCIFRKNVQIIRITNPTYSKPVIKDGLINTSKSDIQNHGLGLFNIRHTVNKYNGNFEIQHKDNLFILEVGFTIQQSR